VILKPNAVATPGVCARCGAEIPAFFVVILCDECLDSALRVAAGPPAFCSAGVQPCARCGGCAPFLDHGCKPCSC
jgi:hypothetical protein